MKAKRLLLLASLPLTVAAILGVVVMLTPRPGVTKANYDRIEIGMKQSEVEAILGKPTVDSFGYGWSDWNGPSGGAWACILFREDIVIQKGWRGPWETESLPAKILRWITWK